MERSALRLFEDRWHVADLLRRPSAASVVRVARTSHPFGTTIEVAESFETLIRVLDAHARARLSLLMDPRNAPLVLDPDLEKAIAVEAHALFRRFSRVAVLVRYAAGRMQVLRQTRKAGILADVFVDEEAAMAYAAGR